MVRLKGFVSIVNALLPVLLAGALAWAAVAVWSILEDELRPPVQQLIDDAGRLAAEATAAAAAVDAAAGSIAGDAAKIQDAVAAALAPLGNLGITVPAIRLPALQPKKCQLDLRKDAWNLGSCFGRGPNLLANFEKALNAELRKPLAPMLDAFATVEGAIADSTAELDKLAPLAVALRAQAAEFTDRAEALAASRDRLANRLGRVATVAGWVLAALLVWGGVSYLLWVHERLAIGWHMLARGTRP